MQRREFLRLGSLAGLGLGAGSNTGVSCILLWQSGGLSHLDTFDMKPEAPREIRGEFKPIATAVPGMRISEHLPRTARLAGTLTILRSMCSNETNHERAAHYLETGRRLSPGLAVPRLAFAPAGDSGLWREPASVRDSYGDTPLGRGCLRARRMVEAGARFVSAGESRLEYDTHTENFRRLKENLLPEFDRAFSALLTDLDGRGLLETTLVVAMGEFGRTPRINAQGGRDHHSRAWSIVLAGAGLPGGRVLGATDRIGAEVTDLPVSPEDLTRTIYRILRIDPAPPHLAGARVVEPLLA